FDFYDKRLPAKVTTGRYFDSWWKKERQKNPTLLDFDPEALLNDDSTVTEDAFQDHWKHGSIDYELTYRFEPGDPMDGVTIMVPVHSLAGLENDGFGSVVQGLSDEVDPV